MTVSPSWASLQNLSGTGLGPLLCLCIMPSRNEEMIQRKGGSEQGERSECDLTAHNAALLAVDTVHAPLRGLWLAAKESGILDPGPLPSVTTGNVN